MEISQYISNKPVGYRNRYDRGEVVAWYTLPPEYKPK